MRFKEFCNTINEAPIRNWEVDPDFYSNEEIMRSKFTGYDREEDHFNKSDKDVIFGSTHIEKIKNKFLKVPYDFNFYFWNSTTPDYDITMDKGIVDDEWISENLGKHTLDYVKKTRSSDSITVIFSNNVSQGNKISYKSAWIIAHRLGHVLTGGRELTEQSHLAYQAMDTFVLNLMKNLYGHRMPNQDTMYAYNIKQEYLEIYKLIFGHNLGTFASARNKQLVTPYEWLHETFAQWLMTGKITLNSLENIEHERNSDVITTDKEKLAAAQRAWEKFPKILSKKFENMMQSYKGKVILL